MNPPAPNRRSRGRARRPGPGSPPGCLAFPAPCPWDEYTTRGLLPCTCVMQRSQYGPELFEFLFNRSRSIVAMTHARRAPPESLARVHVITPYLWRPGGEFHRSNITETDDSTGG